MKTRKRSTGLIALLATVCMLLGTMGTFAENSGFSAVDPVTVDVETGMVTITGLLNQAEEQVVLMVFLPGTVTDGILKTPNQLAENLYYTNTTKADKDGEFSITFDMTQGPNGRGATGEYPFVIACDEVKTGSISYANRDELLAAIAAIADCTTAAGVQTALTPARAAVLGISVDLATDAQTLTETDAITAAYGAVLTAVSAAEFYKTKVVTGAETICNAFEKPAAFALLRSTREATKLQTYIEKYNTIYGFDTGTDSDYAKITAAENRAIVYAALASDADFTSEETAKASFAKAALVGYINDITATGTLLTVLRENAATLEAGLSVTLDFTAYDALTTDSQRANVMAEVEKATMSNAKAVVEQFNASVANYVNAGGGSITTTPSASGNHSGGGGGGSWTGLPTTGDTVTAPETDNDVQNKTGFNDLDGCEWAWEAIADLQNRGVVNGKDTGVFDPNGNVTRAEFVKMIVKAFGLATNGGGQVFADVSLNDWYYEVVSIAATCNIVNGYGSEFAPNATITREDMAVILMRAAQYVDKALTSGTADGFADADAISDYAREAVGMMKAGGIINGMEDGTFRPQQNATRAEACKMIYALMQ